MALLLRVLPRRHARGLIGPSVTGVLLAPLLVTNLLGGVDLAEAVLPTGELRLADGGTAYAAPAWFGLQLPEEEGASFLPLRVPNGDADGCGEVTVDDPPADGGGFVLLVERGNCFFDVKALAAQEAGAEGLVVMNSIEGIYQVCCCLWICDIIPYIHTYLVLEYYIRHCTYISYIPGIVELLRMRATCTAVRTAVTYTYLYT